MDYSSTKKGNLFSSYFQGQTEIVNIYIGGGYIEKE